MSLSKLKQNDSLVAGLRSALREGQFGLADVPKLIKNILRDGRWRDRVLERTGARVTFERFEQFVAAPPLEGLGTDVALLQRLCRDDAEAMDLLDHALQNQKRGRPPTVDTVNTSPIARPTGNSMAYALRRLRGTRPDLHAQVLAGELTAHAAMQAAGFRPRTVSVRLQPQNIAARLHRECQLAQLDWVEFRARLIDALKHETTDENTNTQNA